MLKFACTSASSHNTKQRTRQCTRCRSVSSTDEGPMSCESLCCSGECCLFLRPPPITLWYALVVLAKHSWEPSPFQAFSQDDTVVTRTNSCDHNCLFQPSIREQASLSALRSQAHPCKPSEKASGVSEHVRTHFRIATCTRLRRRY